MFAMGSAPILFYLKQNEVELFCPGGHSPNRLVAMFAVILGPFGYILWTRCDCFCWNSCVNLMFNNHLNFSLLQKLPSRHNASKSIKVAETVDMGHDEFMKVKSRTVKIVQSNNKRGRGSALKGRSKSISKTKQNNGRRRSAKVAGNLNQRVKQQGGGSQGRGRRTVRKRRVGKKAVEDLLLDHRGASRSNNIARESLRNLDEDWDDEKASPMTPIHMGTANISNSTEEAESDDNVQAMESDDNVQAVESDDNGQAVESDDNGQAVEYDQGNWEIGFNGNPSRWQGDLVGTSDEDVEASEDDNHNENGIEENEEDSEADVMSEGSDATANRIVNEEESSDSDVSEDSSD